MNTIIVNVQNNESNRNELDIIYNKFSTIFIDEFNQLDDEVK